MPEWMTQSSQLTDVGKARRHNEDYVAYYEPDKLSVLETWGRLYVLADGVGGSAAGEIASEYAVKKILFSYYNDKKGSLPDRLQRAIEAANSDIFVRNRRREDQREMATTIVAAIVHSDQLTVANVGDSRAYLIHDQTIQQITQDHSLVAEMVSEGALTREQAERHPYRNVILRSIGPMERVKVDVFSYVVAPNHVFVLCSDGLTRRVTDQEITHVASAYPPDEATRRLVALANERGGEDNISVSITRIMDQITLPDRLTNRRPPPQMPRWEEF